MKGCNAINTLVGLFKSDCFSFGVCLTCRYNSKVNNAFILVPIGQKRDSFGEILEILLKYIFLNINIDLIGIFKKNLSFALFNCY